MLVEITTNMQHSDIKDRKSRAVKRAPKVVGQGFPTQDPHPNTPCRQACTGQQQIPPPQKGNHAQETCTSEAAMEGWGGFLEQVMLQHAVVWGEGIQRLYLTSVRTTCAKIQRVWCNPKVQTSTTKGRGAATQLH